MPRMLYLTPMLLVLLGAVACSDYRDDDDYPPPPGPEVDVFFDAGCWYYWDGFGYCFWDGYAYRPWVYGHANYYYGPRGTIVVGGPRGCIGPRGVLPPPPGFFHDHPILRGGPRGGLRDGPRGGPHPTPGRGYRGGPPRGHGYGHPGYAPRREER
jgi:hypothetical protein